MAAALTGTRAQEGTPERARASRRRVELPLLDLANQLQDLDRVRAKLLRKLVLDGLRRLRESGLVDVVDDLHPDLLQLVGRVLLELECHRRLFLGDLVR